MPALADILRLEPPEAAPQLIGHVLTFRRGDEVIKGVITETEAYTADDPASHSYQGLSARNAAMFGKPGDIYVYFIYGMHYCFNIVTGTKKGGAVLIRSVKIIQGSELAWHRRYGTHMPENPSAQLYTHLSDGPAKVAQIFAITTVEGHTSVFHEGSPIRLSSGTKLSEHARIIQTPRVGIAKAAHVPWRWIVQGTS